MIVWHAFEAEIATPTVTIWVRMVRGVFLAACWCLWESWPVDRPQDVCAGFLSLLSVEDFPSPSSWSSSHPPGVPAACSRTVNYSLKVTTTVCQQHSVSEQKWKLNKKYADADADWITLRFEVNNISGLFCWFHYYWSHCDKARYCKVLFG